MADSRSTDSRSTDSRSTDSRSTESRSTESSSAESRTVIAPSSAPDPASVSVGEPHDIGRCPVHLGLGANVSVEPEFSGEMTWYEDYGARHLADGNEGRLVSMYTFTESWPMWEMHPVGSELVLCVSGSIDLWQERLDGSLSTVRLGVGQYAVNEPGVWHTADVLDSASVVFITAGTGTEHRPR